MNDYRAYVYGDYNSIYHHGVKGQKWGKRRYQNEDGSLTPEGRERYGRMEDGYVRRESPLAGIKRMRLGERLGNRLSKGKMYKRNSGLPTASDVMDSVGRSGFTGEQDESAFKSIRSYVDSKRKKNKRGMDLPSIDKVARSDYMNSKGHLTVKDTDSKVTKRVKNDYNNLSDKEFKKRYAVTKERYAKRVKKYGDPYMNSPLAKIGKKLRSRKDKNKEFGIRYVRLD